MSTQLNCCGTVLNAFSVQTANGMLDVGARELFVAAWDSSLILLRDIG
jgi:hypothetical protein